jgi:hypothetical protein
MLDPVEAGRTAITASHWGQHMDIKTKKREGSVSLSVLTFINKRL